MKKAHQSPSLRLVLAGRLGTFLLLQAAGQCYNKVNFSATVQKKVNKLQV